MADAMLKQDEILSELLDIVSKQREALKTGRLSDLQDLMSDMRHVSVRCQAIETKRSRLAEAAAGVLRCEPVVSDIVGRLPAEEAEVLSGAAQRLTVTVAKLKSEMSILSRLMEEAKTLNQMLMTEWRKLGQKSLGFASMGTFDTRV